MGAPTTHEPRELPETPMLPRSFWLSAASVTIIPASVMVASFVLFRGQMSGRWFWPVQSFATLAIMGAIALAYRVQMGRLRRFVHGQGFRVCPRCHYSLGATETMDRCPECGTRNDPSAIRAMWDRWLSAS